MTPTISKSQYLRGLQCNKALWLSRNRKDLQLEPSPAKKDILDTGNLIGKLAMDNYPAGVEVTNEYWDINGATKYDEYSHDVSAANPSSATSATNLYDARFFVITEDYNVYKCLSNGTQDHSAANASTVKPDHTTLATPIESDGYEWKFMYSISASDVIKFVTGSYT